MAVYKVTVATGDMAEAGTNNSISITLVGSHGESRQTTVSFLFLPGKVGMGTQGVVEMSLGHEGWHRLPQGCEGLHGLSWGYKGMVGKGLRKMEERGSRIWRKKIWRMVGKGPGGFGGMVFWKDGGKLL